MLSIFCVFFHIILLVKTKNLLNENGSNGDLFLETNHEFNTLPFDKNDYMGISVDSLGLFNDIFIKVDTSHSESSQYSEAPACFNKLNQDDSFFRQSSFKGTKRNHSFWESSCVIIILVATCLSFILPRAGQRLFGTARSSRPSLIPFLPSLFIASILLSSTNCQNIFVCGGIPPERTTEVCSGHGTCTSQDNCKCFNHYELWDTGFPVACNVTSCNGKWNHNSTESEICNGHGSCMEYNKCTCDVIPIPEIYPPPPPLYAPPYCISDWKCAGVDKTHSFAVCSGRGICKEPDYCECFHDYEGEICEDWSCFHYHHKHEKVCSGNGMCEKPDVCECESGYHGPVCEDNTIPIAIILGLTPVALIAGVIFFAVVVLVSCACCCICVCCVLMCFSFAVFAIIPKRRSDHYVVRKSGGKETSGSFAKIGGKKEEEEIGEREMDDDLGIEKPKEDFGFDASGTGYLGESNIEYLDTQTEDESSDDVTMMEQFDKL